MPVPNQITACASSTLQGVYTPEIHVYNEEAHPKYGLLLTRYYFKGKTRSRKNALATAKSFIKQAKGMSTSETRRFFSANCAREMN